MIKHQIRVGTVENEGSLFIDIEWTEGKLSITGVTGPKSNGDARGSCGQNRGDLLRITDYAKGWNETQAKKLHDIWQEWHLNDMVAGSPAQEAHLKANPVQYQHPQSHYEKALEVLTEAGLQPDPNHIHNGKPYSYGSAWLRKEVPAKVVEWLLALPEADRPNPWNR